MDNFMDKIAQKLTSQDMIRANQAADAAELQNLETQMALFKEQMGKYDDCLQEMRKLNLKNIESAQGVAQLADEAGEKLGKTVEEIESASVSKIRQTSDMSIAGIKQTSDVSIEGINKTVAESLAKIAEIKLAQEKAAKSNKVILPFVTITMILSLVSLGISVARILGLF